jgi:hypothetical protein
MSVIRVQNTSEAQPTFGIPIQDPDQPDGVSYINSGNIKGLAAVIKNYTKNMLAKLDKSELVALYNFFVKSGIIERTTITDDDTTYTKKQLAEIISPAKNKWEPGSARPSSARTPSSPPPPTPRDEGEDEEEEEEDEDEDDGQYSDFLSSLPGTPVSGRQASLPLSSARQAATPSSRAPTPAATPVASSWLQSLFPSRTAPSNPLSDPLSQIESDLDTNGRVGSEIIEKLQAELRKAQSDAAEQRRLMDALLAAQRASSADTSRLQQQIKDLLAQSDDDALKECNTQVELLRRNLTGRSELIQQVKDMSYRMGRLYEARLIANKNGQLKLRELMLESQEPNERATTKNKIRQSLFDSEAEQAQKEVSLELAKTDSDDPDFSTQQIANELMRAQQI